MMGRLNHDQEQFFYSFCLDEAVPNDHPVREVAFCSRSELGALRTGALLSSARSTIDRSGADDPDAHRRLRVCNSLGAGAMHVMSE